MSKRTVLRFSHTGDIWPIVEGWARQNGYRQKEAAGPERVYQKGVGFLVAPMMLKVRYEKQEANIEAWVRANILVRLMSLFTLPKEMGIESGGFRAVMPRNIARKAVSELLAELGQPAVS
jgi:hypothetical protein